MRSSDWEAPVATSSASRVEFCHQKKRLESAEAFDAHGLILRIGDFDALVRLETRPGGPVQS
jgi:hypothetical protein